MDHYCIAAVSTRMVHFSIFRKDCETAKLVKINERRLKKITVKAPFSQVQNREIIQKNGMFRIMSKYFV